MRSRAGRADGYSVRAPQLKTAIALFAVALTSLVGARAVEATPQQLPSGGFGGPALPGRIEVNLGGGTLRQIDCAPGAQPGASCYVAREKKG